jgi:tyrosyl-tRNA synthetase
MPSLFAELESRGCIQDVSHPEELRKLLDNEAIAFYCGFDPTADSLHVGSMLPLVLMRRLQRAGHKPLALLGTATGMIGDPSGKSEERKLLSPEIIAHNAECIAKQIGLFLDTSGSNGYELVRNDSWLGAVSMIEFLRDTGKHFSVNTMMAKESVKNRLNNREQGISYTEFSYMLLQAYDYRWLHQNRGCRLQVGGSDQWGNITAGLELIRRSGEDAGPSAYGMTFPLLTTASGSKFGKTEAGAVWLDRQRTSSYRFFQFWKNTEDADVIRYLKLFTDIPLEQIEELAAAVATRPEKREAQLALARDLTTLLHGASETERAVQASEVLFGGSLSDIDPETLLDIFGDVPSAKIPRSSLAAGINILDLLVQCNAAPSKGAARRTLEAGGIYLNNERVSDIAAVVTTPQAIAGSIIVLRSGKKSYFLVQAVEG